MEAASNFYSGGESLASPAQPIIVVTVPPSAIPPLRHAAVLTGRMPLQLRP